MRPVRIHMQAGAQGCRSVDLDELPGDHPAGRGDQERRVLGDVGRWCRSARRHGPGDHILHQRLCDLRRKIIGDDEPRREAIRPDTEMGPFQRDGSSQRQYAGPGRDGVRDADTSPVYTGERDVDDRAAVGGETIPGRLDSDVDGLEVEIDDRPKSIVRDLVDRRVELSAGVVDQRVQAIA